MRFAAAFAIAAVSALSLWLLGAGFDSAKAADAAVTYQATTYQAVPFRHARYVCNKYGRCWPSHFATPEDEASGQLIGLNRVNKRRGICVGYNYQYAAGWDECAGDWNYGRGRIYH